MKHELFPSSVRGIIPPLYSQEKNENPMVVVKFFTPMNRWTWFVLEGESIDDQPDNFMFFGLVVGGDVELGYFYLSDLETCFIERDLHFRPKSLQDVRDSI